MFKNMKLGTKITCGFVALIIIAVALGSLAVWKMSNVQSQSAILANEYVPSVSAANEVERNSLVTMYNMVAFAFSEEQSYWDKTQKQFELIKDSLKKAGELAAKSKNLDALKTNVAAASAKVNEYEQLANQTKAKTDALNAEQEKSVKAAQDYMKICYEYLDGQNKKMQDEFVAAVNDANQANKKTETAKFEERLNKITLAKDIIDLGNWIQTGTYKSIAHRDPELFKSTQAKFADVYRKLDEIKPITHTEADLKRIDECRSAAKAYDDCMTSFLTNWLAREELGKQRLVVANAVL
jgi:methyl-accepting chemotaxis protein